jgi:hypothetical protein
MVAPSRHQLKPLPPAAPREASRRTRNATKTCGSLRSHQRVCAPAWLLTPSARRRRRAGARSARRRWRRSPTARSRATPSAPPACALRCHAAAGCAQAAWHAATQL